MEVKDLVSYLGYNPEEVSDLDALKKKFDSDFIRRNSIKDDAEIVNSLIGSRMGSITTAVKRSAKELGIEIPEEYKDKKVEELVSFVTESFNNTHKSKVEELEKALKQGGDEAVKSWQDKYSKLENKYKDTTTLLSKLQEDIELEKKKGSEAIKSFKIDNAYKSAFGSVAFKSDITEVEKKGFEAIFGSKYILDLDDEGKEFIAEKESGKRIPNPNKAGSFMSIQDVLDMEADKAGLKKKNNAGGGNPRPPFQKATHDPNPNPGNQGGNKRRRTYDER